jgi:elongation factor Tu
MSGKPRVQIGVLGQQGHGKTTLARALEKHHWDRVFNTCYDEDRHRSPGRPWIAASAADTLIEWQFLSAKREYTLADCKRHRDYVHALVTGNVRIDAAVLVVAADDGPTEETRGQIRLARWLGMYDLVVFLYKVDVFEHEPALIDLAEQDTRLALAERGYPADDVTVVRGSARAAFQAKGWADSACTCLQHLLAGLDACDLPPVLSPLDLPFLIPVGDVFSIEGRGVVVVGSLERGRVRVGDEVELVGLSPTSHRGVVSGVEMFSPPPPRDTIGLLLGGIDRAAVEGGQVLAAPGSIGCHSHFEAVVYLLSPQEGGRRAPFYSGYRPQFYLHGHDFDCTLALLPDACQCSPGETVRVVVSRDAGRPLALEVGTRFALREGARTVGVGVITRLS